MVKLLGNVEIFVSGARGRVRVPWEQAREVESGPFCLWLVFFLAAMRRHLCSNAHRTMLVSKALSPLNHELRFPKPWAKYICLLSKYLVQGLFHYSHGRLIQQSSSSRDPAVFYILRTSTISKPSLKQSSDLILCGSQDDHALWSPWFPVCPQLQTGHRVFKSKDAGEASVRHLPPPLLGHSSLGGSKNCTPELPSISDYLRREDFILAWLLFVLKVTLQNSASPSRSPSRGLAQPWPQGIDLHTQC